MSADYKINEIRIYTYIWNRCLVYYFITVANFYSVSLEKNMYGPSWGSYYRELLATVPSWKSPSNLDRSSWAFLVSEIRVNNKNFFVVNLQILLEKLVFSTYLTLKKKLLGKHNYFNIIKENKNPKLYL